MDERTAALVSQLAAKLGTTAEHLWSVLLKQAAISAATDVLQYLILGVAVWAFIKWIRPRWDDLSEGAAICAVVGGAVLAIISIVAFFSFPTTIAAVVNPDYWALKEVLSSVRSK